MVSRSDRDYVVSLFKGKIRNRIDAILKEKAELIEAIEEGARASVDEAQLGKDAEYDAALKEESDRIYEERRAIADKYGCGIGFVKTRYEAAVEDEKKRRIAERIPEIAVLEEKMSVVRTTVIFATTDAKLREAITSISQALDIDLSEVML